MFPDFTMPFDVASLGDAFQTNPMVTGAAIPSGTPGVPPVNMASLGQSLEPNQPVPNVGDSGYMTGGARQPVPNVGDSGYLGNGDGGTVGDTTGARASTSNAPNSDEKKPGAGVSADSFQKMLQGVRAPTVPKAVMPSTPPPPRPYTQIKPGDLEGLLQATSLTQARPVNLPYLGQFVGRG